MPISMEYRIVPAFYLVAMLLLTGCGEPNAEQKTEEIVKSDFYELVEDWPNLPEGFLLGMPTGLGLDSDDNIVIFHRAGRPWQFPPPENKIENDTILTLDSETGEVLKSWGADLFLMPHGLEVDQEDNIWVTDVGLQQILKFNSDGELLMTLGEANVLGNDSSHFSLPSDVAVAPDGSFYVSDGYGNSRVIKFSREGSFLLEWGLNSPVEWGSDDPDRELNIGDKEGEFNLPHGIDLDENGNVYVADRENNRIQKFDAEGNFIAVWQNPSADQLYSITIDPANDRLFAVDYMTVKDTVVNGSDIFRFDLDLNLQLQFGRTGYYNGPTSKYHDIVIDDEGNIYVGDLIGNQVQKFRLKESE